MAWAIQEKGTANTPYYSARSLVAVATRAQAMAELSEYPEGAGMVVVRSIQETGKLHAVTGLRTGLWSHTVMAEK